MTVLLQRHRSLSERRVKACPLCRCCSGRTTMTTWRSSGAASSTSLANHVMQLTLETLRANLVVDTKVRLKKEADGTRVPLRTDGTRVPLRTDGGAMKVHPSDTTATTVQIGTSVMKVLTDRSATAVLLIDTSAMKVHPAERGGTRVLLIRTGATRVLHVSLHQDQTKTKTASPSLTKRQPRSSRRRPSRCRRFVTRR